MDCASILYSIAKKTSCFHCFSHGASLHHRSFSRMIFTLVIYILAKRCICADIHLLVGSKFVILFPKNQRLKGYITDKLPNISRCIADITPIGNGYML